MAARRAGEQSLTRNMIMDASRYLFTEKGYQYVSMRQIAKELKCSHGAIYYHFKNKAELFYALVSDHFRKLDAKIKEIVGKDMNNTEKLRQILLGFIEFGLTHQSHYEIMFMIKDDEVRTFINQGPMKTYAFFARQVASLSERRLSAREIWSIFLSLHGFVSHYLKHVLDFNEVKSAAEFHVEMLMKWVSAS